MTLSTALANLQERVLVISLKSQLDNVIGRQFLSSLVSFPSFGSSLRYDISCEGANLPIFSA